MCLVVLLNGPLHQDLDLGQIIGRSVEVGLELIVIELCSLCGAEGDSCRHASIVLLHYTAHQWLVLVQQCLQLQQAPPTIYYCTYKSIYIDQL